MTFYTNETVYCPVCLPLMGLSNPPKRIGVVLDCIESNYSGCCVDIAECPQCKNVFEVTYKVDSIKKVN